MSIAPLCGAWRLESAHVEFADSGEKADTLGPDPQGRILFTESGRMMGMITASGRKLPESSADYEGLFRAGSAVGPKQAFTKQAVLGGS